MKWIALPALVFSLGLAGCGGSRNSSAEQQLQQQADYWQINQIERTWHLASSTKNLPMMMSLWAPDATFTIGTGTLQGKGQIRNFFKSKAGAFRPENDWVSETPAFKVRITVSGDKGTLYFECIYVDRRTGKVDSVVGADENVQKIGGHWLITSSASATPTL